MQVTFAKDFPPILAKQSFRQIFYRQRFLPYGISRNGTEQIEALFHGTEQIETLFHGTEQMEMFNYTF